VTELICADCIIHDGRSHSLPGLPVVTFINGTALCIKHARFRGGQA
jgi:hypothetical protein